VLDLALFQLDCSPVLLFIPEGGVLVHVPGSAPLFAVSV